MTGFRIDELRQKREEEDRDLRIEHVAEQTLQEDRAKRGTIEVLRRMLQGAAVAGESTSRP